MQPLAGKIALVAGATRGAGRGIACMLGEAGATVYCTGRSSRADQRSVALNDAPFVLAHRPETIEETAEMVTRYGGNGIAVQVDHSDPTQVQALIERIRRDHGQLDVLVNDIWGGEELMQWGVPFWQQSLEKGLQMQRSAIHTHLITNYYALPLMIERAGGLVVEVTDGDTLDYRGTLFYDLAKTSVIRLAFGLAQELKPFNITALAITPGFLRSEAMLEHFGVTEATWRDGAAKDPHFIASETPYFVGRAVAALAGDPQVFAKTGGAYSSWGLAREYGFSDINGEHPDWGAYFEQHVKPLMP